MMNLNNYKESSQSWKIKCTELILKENPINKKLLKFQDKQNYLKLSNKSADLNSKLNVCKNKLNNVKRYQKTLLTCTKQMDNLRSNHHLQN